MTVSSAQKFFCLSPANETSINLMPRPKILDSMMENIDANEDAGAISSPLNDLNLAFVTSVGSEVDKPLVLDLGSLLLRIRIVDVVRLQKILG
jgi:hypothetical protein